ncbi:MAG: pantothenate kinase [Gammaproteobacteria bacterium RIFCSPHIGHO2_12_FULL_45_12]|nr:MAG: pantothenate kinase [Gammaproteobacteria bacterium RIFCSPHIGHO2_12_FULL_45_12]
MLLCLDIGNTHILGGIYDQQGLVMRFRCATSLIGTADQFGIFLVNVLQTKGIQVRQIEAAALCSVVPGCDYTIRHGISNYFDVPCFTLKAGVKTGLNIKYKNANEVGADRIANAIGAMEAFPQQNIIIIDMGTATTVCAVTRKGDYLGGAIFPGLRLGMESLKNNTAKLVEVDIDAPSFYIGRTTRESIQAGLYYGQLGALKEIIAGFKQEMFCGEAVKVIGTGGFSQLYKEKSLFDVILPDLVLQGLQKAHAINLILTREITT